MLLTILGDRLHRILTRVNVWATKPAPRAQFQSIQPMVDVLQIQAPFAQFFLARIMSIFKKWVFSGFLVNVKVTLVEATAKKFIRHPSLRSGCRITPKTSILKVIPNSNFFHEKSPLTSLDNAYFFKGSENMILQERFWTCEYTCQFEYYWYPFDTQNCFIINNVTSYPYKIKVEEVTYKGSTNVGRTN